MLDGTDPALLYEWQAYYDLEPFGEERADIRNAINCMAIVQAFGTKKKGGQQFTLQDFIPDFTKAAKPKEIDPITAQKIMQERYGNNSQFGRKPHRKNR